MRERQTLEDVQSLMARLVEVLKLKAELERWDARDRSRVSVSVGYCVVMGQDLAQSQASQLELGENYRNAATDIVERVERYLYDEARAIRSKLAALGVKIEN